VTEKNVLYLPHLVKGLGTLGAESSGVNFIKLVFIITDAAAKQARVFISESLFSLV
jgi:hypothetical protein